MWDMYINLYKVIHLSFLEKKLFKFGGLLRINSALPKYLLPKELDGSPEKINSVI